MELTKGSRQPLEKQLPSCVGASTSHVTRDVEFSTIYSLVQAPYKFQLPLQLYFHITNFFNLIDYESLLYPSNGRNWLSKIPKLDHPC